MSENIAVLSEDSTTPKVFYGGTVTVAGRHLITSLIAGETIEFTRVAVGKGKMPEGVEPIDMSDLVEPVAAATSTVPYVENGVLYMTVEYRNDMNGGLEQGFWLSEFAVYAKTANTEEICLYYATLGDSPQPVNAYKDNRIDIRRYPISIALEVDAEVEVSYNPGAFVTAEEADQLIQQHVKEAVDKIASSFATDIVIPIDSWVAFSSDEPGYEKYNYIAEIAVEGCTDTHVPHMAFSIPCEDAAAEAEISRTAETIDGFVRFWAKSVPTQNLDGTIELRSENLKDTSPGENDGCDCDHATDEEVNDAIGEIFGDVSAAVPPATIATDAEVQKTVKDIFG